jgi:glyoxylase-like metal-dependent hydrolase (beta-lactamase superfamily II)
MIGHQSLHVKKPGQRITVRKVCDPEKTYEVESVIVAGDAILNKAYAKRFFDGDFEHTVFNVSFYDGTYLERIQKGKDIGSMARLFKLVDEGALIIPGHGEPFYLRDIQ